MELESLDCFDCACDTCVRVVSADSVTGVRCSARTVRGTAVTRCWGIVTSSFESPDVGIMRSLCCRHQDLFMRHATCLYCNCFSDTGWFASCSACPEHSTHLRCAVRNSGVLFLCCSHCNHQCRPSFQDRIVKESIPFSISMQISEESSECEF
ncbi:hypothetical protein ANCCAN_28714 [Ancylostoma caninum]|uniref:Uncharacterized protein n=1 Tax=Ancylostoma caninum TaxID=29170 RepID=A0A368F0H6_ANCCA|nr:hypothetical protein ANCCAN_28714 [Ancylostoma caninum]